METSTNIVLTRKHLKKLFYVLDSIGGSMESDDLVNIAFLNNTIMVETDDIVTIIKLEKQE